MKIGILGAGGRMGRANIAELTRLGLTLAGAVDAPGTPAIGQDAGVLAGLDPLGVTVGDDPVEAFARADVVIDFTLPEATETHCKLAIDSGVALVIGTTGLSAAQQQAVGRAAVAVPVVQAANFSLGVNLARALTRQLAAQLDESWDIEVLEMHHRHKVDVPSGTALALGHAAAAGRGVALDDVQRLSRAGQTGARPAGEIGFATLRGGNVAGEHAVIFAAEDERLEIHHKATDRAIFARGAVRAAGWVVGKPAGLYSMDDVLGF